MDWLVSSLDAWQGKGMLTPTKHRMQENTALGVYAPSGHARDQYDTRVLLTAAVNTILNHHLRLWVVVFHNAMCTFSKVRPPRDSS